VTSSSGVLVRGVGDGLGVGDSEGLSVGDSVPLEPHPPRSGRPAPSVARKRRRSMSEWSDPREKAFV
jgi:hypothetical protein